jgi:AraC-like DNA-binding protein/mannose-6-phosphate isomerase-like protein (cupin superfamily)
LRDIRTCGGRFLSGLRQIVSEMRQNGFLDPIGHPRAQVVTLKRDYPDGHFFPLHFHNRDQVVYASQGVLTVWTTQGTWVVPAPRAVWIPARTPHEVHMSGRVSLRTLYLTPGIARDLPRNCCVLNVSAFLRELILYACEFPTLDRRMRVQAHLISVVLDQLSQVRTIPLQLPHPLDPRAWHVAEILLDTPGDERTTEDICRSAGGSKRTIERLFQRETGLSLGRWRQQVRMMQALQLLARGEKIANAAVGAGYSTPSAFIVSFKKALGITPAKYFHKHEESMSGSRSVKGKRQPFDTHNPLSF